MGVTVNIARRLQAHGHAVTIDVTPAAANILSRLQTIEEQWINRFLTSFFASSRVIERMSLGEKRVLLGFLKLKWEKLLRNDSHASLDGAVSAENQYLRGFAQKNDLAFCVVTLQLRTPTAQLVGEPQDRISPPRQKTVFVSAHDAVILQLEQKLDGTKPYGLEIVEQKEQRALNVTEETQKFLVDLVFPCSDQSLTKAVLTNRLGRLLWNLADSFVHGSEKGEEYLAVVLKALVLAYLDPYFPRNQFDRIGRRFLALYRWMEDWEKRGEETACAKRRLTELIWEVLQSKELEGAISPDAGRLSATLVAQAKVEFSQLLSPVLNEDEQKTLAGVLQISA